jgi:hypothetical protein
VIHLNWSRIIIKKKVEMKKKVPKIFFIENLKFPALFTFDRQIAWPGSLKLMQQSAA